MIRHSISKFHHWLLRTIVRKYIVQGPYHHDNVAELLGIVGRATRKEFSEDNSYTRYYFLMEGFERSFALDSRVKPEMLDNMRKWWHEAEHKDTFKPIEFNPNPLF